jgi:hypothetical protein
MRFIPKFNANISIVLGIKIYGGDDTICLESGCELNRKAHPYVHYMDCCNRCKQNSYIDTSGNVLKI